MIGDHPLLIQSKGPDGAFFSCRGALLSHRRPLAQRVIQSSSCHHRTVTQGHLAYETYGSNNSLNSGNTVFGKRDATRAAVSYKVIPELRLVGFYQSANSKSGTVNDSGDVTGVGVEYMVAPKTALKAHYMNRKADAANKDATMYTVGAEYPYSKELRFYASYAGLDNGTAGSLTPWKEGRTAQPSGTTGKDATGLSVGMRYDF